MTVLLSDAVEVGRRALDTYTRATYGMPLETLETIQLLVTGPREMVRERLHEYIAAGARHVVCRLGALGLKEQLDQLERLAGVLM